MSELTRCPVCCYDLHGLPLSHRCPECGFQYDRETAIWRPPRPWKGHGITLMVIVIGLIPVSIRVAHTWSAGVGPGLWDAGILMAALLCGAYSFLHIRSTNRKGRCVVISPAGVFVRTEQMEQLIPFNDLAAFERVDRRIKEERDEYVLQIRTRSSSFPVEIDEIFLSEAERALFIEAVESRLSRRNDVPQAPPTLVADAPRRPPTDG